MQVRLGCYSFTWYQVKPGCHAFTRYQNWETRSTFRSGLDVNGVLEWVTTPHWLVNGRMVCLYGPGQYSPQVLAFGVELGTRVISLYLYFLTIQYFF